MNAATSTRTRSVAKAPALDEACAAAVDLALAAAEDVAGIGRVGRHLGVSADGERIVSHFFACQEVAYRGWRWAVTVTRASRSRLVTVDETVLLPGDDALLAPEWLPWSERLRPGDLGVGDLLPTDEDDERLVPAYTGAADEAPAYPEPAESALEAEAGASWPVLFFELGLGRARVLSREGREEAAQRWYVGDHGPRAPISQAAPARCATCGFLAPMGGMLSQAFGVCANEFSPSDGQVVSLDHGCGAHSEAAVVPTPLEISEPIVDEFTVENIVLHSVTPAAGSGSVDGDDEPAAEELGHS